MSSFLIPPSRFSCICVYSFFLLFKDYFTHYIGNESHRPFGVDIFILKTKGVSKIEVPRDVRNSKGP